MDIFNLDSQIQRIVIIGGGFGGIEIAKHIDTKKYEVLLLDRHNYFTFQPLLYQVASGGLEPDSVAYPLRKILSRRKNIIFRMATVFKIDPELKQVNTNIGSIPYNILIIACGSTPNFFGMKETEDNSLSLKTIPDALNMRSFILQNFEAALLSTDKEEQKQLMNFVIVGAGPTGVEISGALSELRRHVLPYDYPELDLNLMEVTIVESGSNVLDAMSDFAKKKSAIQLKELGVTLHLNNSLTSYDGRVAKLKDGTEIKTRSLIWTAGVKGNVPDGLPKEIFVRGNRLVVDDFNRLKNFKDLFAIGDISSMESGAHPMLAPVAMQQGKRLAKNLNIHPDKWKPFKYFDKGTMATIGRSRAVADLWFNIHLKGFLAWMAWLFIHLMLLVGFRNRVIVLWNWVWNYFSYDRAIRLIIRPFKPEDKVAGK